MSDLPQAGERRPIWMPPLVGAGVLFCLFLLATAVRNSPIASSARGVMIVLSTAAAAAVALYGLKMVIDARIRGIGSAVAGAVMVAMGVYTLLHVLR